MNAKQNAKLAMYIVTAGLDTEGDPDILSKMPLFTAHLASLRSTIGTINVLTTKQDHFAANASLDKQSARTILEGQIYDIAASARAMAIKAKELDLADEWHLQPFTLKRAKDGRLLTKARNLATLAASRETDLLPYGITDREIGALIAATDLFESLMPKPRKNRVNKSNITKEIKTAFVSADDTITQMDILADTLRNRHPLFHADYRSRRTIISPPRRITALLGYVRDSSSNPLHGAAITVDGHSISVRSSRKGQFRIPQLPEGVYMLRITLPGYRELVETVIVNNGHTSRPGISMKEV
jgi:carboxypeptidase family protein